VADADTKLHHEVVSHPRFSWGDSTELEDERVIISTLCDYDGAIDCGDGA
jgi:hypothetical protein